MQFTRRRWSANRHKEDRALGDAAQLATKPLIRLMRKEVRDMLVLLRVWLPQLACGVGR